jgi:hypothetical protein
VHGPSLFVQDERAAFHLEGAHSRAASDPGMWAPADFGADQVDRNTAIDQYATSVFWFFAAPGEY